MSTLILLAAAAAPVRGGAPTPARMAPTPAEKLQLIGSTEGMPLYPADPLPGYPGMDPDPAKGRPPRNTPQLVNYPGSIEHWTPQLAYQPLVNPYNYRTLVKNFIAADLPGVAPELIEQYAEPLYYMPSGQHKLIPAGQNAPAARVVRLGPGGQTLKVKFGPLPTSMYVLRVIAAVETKDMLDYPKDLIVECRINDGPQGEMSRYVLRHRGEDNFYSVGEFFFHVEDRREFEAELGLHPDSRLELLAHNVDLHDVLGECAKKAGKRASLLAPPEKLMSYWQVDPQQKIAPLRRGNWSELIEPQRRAQLLNELRAESPGKTDDGLLQLWRKKRDDDIWNSLPPLNVNLAGDEWFLEGKSLSFSRTDAETEAALKEQGLLPLRFSLERADFGRWRLAAKAPDGAAEYYTLDDLKALKPYPGLPFAAPIWGKRFEAKDATACYFSPLAVAAGEAVGRAKGMLNDYGGHKSGVFESSGYGQAYVQRGDLLTGRDLALLLCRFAYDMPSIHPNRYFSRLVSQTLYAHERWQRFYQYFEPLGICESYDYLFPIIQDNQELADAVGRYIRWVKTPDDVRALLDTYLLQFTARDMAYWFSFYDHGNAGRMARLVALQMDPDIVRPWVEFIFSRTWEYPYPVAGVQDHMYLSVQRDGTTNIGSFSYTFPGAVEVAGFLEHYIRNGGDPKYDLTDPKRYPRVAAGLDFLLEGWIAGMQHPGIGDVGGFVRKYGEWLPGKLAGNVNIGWRWTKDPRFAYCALHYGQRETESDAEWQRLLAAAKAARNPFMANRSRILTDWGGYLEGGTQSDDFRFRHGARVRVGRGTGHDHRDSLDLGVWSLGLTMAGDGGARGGYGFPETTISKMHNLVTVDDQNWRGHAWIPQLADMDACQYLLARGLNQKLFERQVALIELDQGRPAAAPPSKANLAPDTRYDNDIVMPRAYVLDVFRTIGGKVHAYNAHAFVEDEFSASVKPQPLAEEDQPFMKNYTLDGRQWAAPVESDHLVLTWRMSRDERRFPSPENKEFICVPCEQAQMGAAYDPNSPRKFMRLHLLGQKGHRLLTGEAIIRTYVETRNDGEIYRQAHLLRTPQEPEASSLFAAVWEPYAGEPVIKDIALEGDPNDALSHAAVRLETTDGIRDLCFADASSERLRELADGVKVQAHFAYLSRDAKGLRQACLVGGKLLETEELTIRPASDMWEATVAAADYFEKVATLDRPLPARLLDGAFFEVAAPQREGHAAHSTTFQAVKLEPRGARTLLTWRKGADVYNGKITEILPDRDAPGVTVVKVAISPTLIPGENTQLAATNERHDRAWRCDVEVKPDYRGDKVLGGILTLYGAPVRPNELKVGERIYLYEFGLGDTWRTPTKVSLRRADDGTYILRANVPCEISLKGTTASSPDGKSWRPLASKGEGHTVLSLSQNQLDAGPLHLRWAQP